MSSLESRRAFLGLAAAGATAALWPTWLRASAGSALRTADRPHVLFEYDDSFEPRPLAAAALDAARAAGASYADVRVDHRISLATATIQRLVGSPYRDEAMDLGVRVLVDGQWGFVGLDAPTVDGAANAARRAVTQAKTNAAARSILVTLPPVPVVTDGRWSTPVAVDPFTVPFREIQELLQAGANAALDVGSITTVMLTVSWRRLDRTFASTEGSFVRQTFTIGCPFGFVAADVPAPKSAPPQHGGASLGRIPELFYRGGGYEVLRDVGLAAVMKRRAEIAAEEAKRIVAMPFRPVEIGRGELVVDATGMRNLVGATIIDALDFDRVLGRQTGTEGTTYASPPQTTLGTLRLGSSLLTVRADRTRPDGITSAQWDDDGVKTTAFPLVERGVVVDYLGTRDTAAALQSWYRQRGLPPAGHGSAMTTQAGVKQPGPGVPDITVDPGRANVGVDELIANVKRGVYLTGALQRLTVDFGVSSAFTSADGAWEIRDGKIVSYLTDAAIQLKTIPFWNGLTALGGPTSVTTGVPGFPSPQPQLFEHYTIQAPPAHFRDVDLVRATR